MSDRRQDERDPTFKAGFIRFGGDVQKVTILNLSGGGAMVDATSEVPEGAELVFECSETGATPARVAWVMGRRCGLTFEAIVSLHDEDEGGLAA